MNKIIKTLIVNLLFFGAQFLDAMITPIKPESRDMYEAIAETIEDVTQGAIETAERRERKAYKPEKKVTFNLDKNVTFVLKNETKPGKITLPPISLPSLFKKSQKQAARGRITLPPISQDVQIQQASQADILTALAIIYGPTEQQIKEYRNRPFAAEQDRLRNFTAEYAATMQGIKERCKEREAKIEAFIKEKNALSELVTQRIQYNETNVFVMLQTGMHNRPIYNDPIYAALSIQLSPVQQKIYEYNNQN